MPKYKISAETFSSFQDFAEVLLYVVVRTVLGIFVSLAVATALYLVSLPVVLSIWARTSVDFDVIGTIFTSTGATAGSFFIWLNRDRTARMQVIFLGLTALFAVAGALIGARVGGDPYDLLGLPGIPILVGMIVGAAFGANTPHFLAAAAKAFKNPRL